MEKNMPLHCICCSRVMCRTTFCASVSVFIMIIYAFIAPHNSNNIIVVYNYIKDKYGEKRKHTHTDAALDNLKMYRDSVTGTKELQK